MYYKKWKLTTQTVKKGNKTDMKSIIFNPTSYIETENIIRILKNKMGEINHVNSFFGIPFCFWSRFFATKNFATTLKHEMWTYVTENLMTPYEYLIIYILCNNLLFFNIQCL